MWSAEPPCDREAEVRKLVRSTVDDPELRAHATNCGVCRETLAVAVWMQELAGLPVDAAAPPNPGYVWWKAQVLRRWENERAAVNPIDIGERVQVGIGLAGALVLLVWLWRELQPLTTPVPGLLTVMVLSGLLIATTAVIACLSLRKPFTASPRTPAGWR